tara:strand:- start:953 stop:1291 length:339 start_codon:yes stop_codon:yes gene_type:complete
MSPEELGRRAVACEGFACQCASLYSSVCCFASSLADFGVPSSVGCLLALVREALDKPRLRPFWSHEQERWYSFVPQEDDGSGLADVARVWGDSEAEVLVLLLEAHNRRQASE